MIIGISGRIGSGKDESAKIIQKLSQVPMQGYMKNAGGEMISATFSPWQIRKFASKLKQTATLLTGVPIEKWEDQEFKKQKMGPEWNMTYREFLQKLGTDAVRDGLHTNTWVNALFADYKEMCHSCGYPDNPSTTLDYKCQGCDVRSPKWLITDVRFPNEAQAIKDRGGLMLRINRPKYLDVALCPEGLTLEQWADQIMTSAHPSETALDDYTFDEVITNDGSLEELEEKLKQFLTNNNLI